MNCLVVDPSVTIRRILINALCHHEHLVFLEASSMARALELSAEGVSLVLTEWNLPDKSGIELTRALRAQESTAAVPIVMITGRNDKDDVTQAIDAGVNGYVLRPFTATGLKLHLDHFAPSEAAA